TPRVREHRALMRQWDYLRRKSSGLKCRLRNILAGYNTDIPCLFTVAGREHVRLVSLNKADRFVAEQVLDAWEHGQEQRRALQPELRKFAALAPLAEQESRAVLASIP